MYNQVKTLAEASFKQANLYNNKEVFLFKGEELSYNQLNKYSNQIAHAIIEESIKPTSRIAFLGKDSFIGYQILFGSAKAKMVFLPINWRLAQQEIFFIIANSQAKIIFVSQEFLPIAEKIIKELSHALQVIVINTQETNQTNYYKWKSRQPTGNLSLAYDRNDIVVQMYTSGTTGNPKGVQLTNNSFFDLMTTMYNEEDLWMELNPQDKLLLSLPIFHIGGLWWAIQGFLSGGIGIILETFQAWKALEEIEKHKITKVAMVPAMIQLSLLEPNINKIDFSSVQGFLYGGSPISPHLLEQAIKFFKCDFFQIYGLTETGNMAVCLRPKDHRNNHISILKSVGKPLPGVKVKVVDKEQNTLPTNSVGEICIKSPSNMIGYWKNEKENKKTLINGWVYTGDAGYFNEEGYLFISDRIKDMIIYADENIYPAEIEKILEQHKDVREVAIIGIPDEKWGEVVKAIIVPTKKSTIDKRALINFLKSKIADYKIPKSFSFIESLPRNPSGKILKQKLRKTFVDKSKTKS